jgi:hypothetical protein
VSGRKLHFIRFSPSLLQIMKKLKAVRVSGRGVQLLHRKTASVAEEQPKIRAMMSVQ